MDSKAPNFPERSGLILARAAHSDDHGVLSVCDASRLSLDADAVMLSSCETGTGKMEGEEGITGLVPALLFAGARGVVGSLWPVDDSATENEMTRFYSHAAQGEDRASPISPAASMRRICVARTSAFEVRGFDLATVLATFYASAVSRLRRPFLSTRTSS